jgi:tRNA(Ile)-lysidine synthase
LNALGPAEFDRLMAACGPFEREPHLAVGVSGGPDSLALMHLLAGWVAARGGKLTALTVDHGLRQNSSAEAGQVARWAQQAGVDHQTLEWVSPKPRAGLQAAAREARYNLLTAWCRDHDVLHLAVAHQLDDQRETVAMRRARDAGENAGLAGMSLISIRQGVRLIRPLLPVPAGLLKDHLQSRGLGWIDDPSNSEPRFERIRWRQGLNGALPSVEDIRRWGEARRVQEAATAGLLSRSVHIHDAGYVLIDLSSWTETGPIPRAQALGHLVAMVGGRGYLPAKAALNRVVDGLIAGGPLQSLGGTLVGTWRGQGLICREAAAVEQLGAIKGPASCRWDGRFLVTVPSDREDLWIDVLGQKGVAEMGQDGHSRNYLADIPPAARPSLPALRDATGRLTAIPHVGFDPYGQGLNVHFHFRPHYSVTSSGFTVAHGWPHTI